MDVERALVSRIIHTGDVNEAISRGITEDHFADEECQKVYNWICDFQRTYKSPPSMEATKQEHPNFEFEISTDSVKYLIDRLVILVKRRMANAALQELVEAAEDPKRAEKIDIEFLDISRQLATVVPSNEVARFSQVGSRIDEYHKAAEEGTPWGIKMGIPKFDELTFGIQPHELIVCAGWQGTGKSTLMQFIAFNAYLQGKTVLFVSLEMESKALLRRFDTMAVNMSYRALKGLELEDEAIDRWQEFAEEAEANADHKDIIIVDRIGSRTPMGIFSETVRHKPDLVVVDYISLLEAPRGAGDKSWQQVGYISRELKLNARTLGVPVIAAAQTNRDSTKDGVSLATIAFSSSIGMDADIVLGLQQDDDMRAEKEMELVIAKNRDGRGGVRVRMNWDMDFMQFGERQQFTRQQPVTPTPEGEAPKIARPKSKNNPFMRGALAGAS